MTHKRWQDPLAFLARHGKERGGFLFHVLAPALRALNVFFVLLQRQDQFEGLMAIVADVIVHGHGDLPLELLRSYKRNCSAKACASSAIHKAIQNGETGVLASPREQRSFINHKEHEVTQRYEPPGFLCVLSA
jgi:hypothetical protein